MRLCIVPVLADEKSGMESCRIEWKDGGGSNREYSLELREIDLKHEQKFKQCIMHC